MAFRVCLPFHKHESKKKRIEIEYICFECHIHCHKYPKSAGGATKTKSIVRWEQWMAKKQADKQRKRRRQQIIKRHQVIFLFSFDENCMCVLVGEGNSANNFVRGNLNHQTSRQREKKRSVLLYACAFGDLLIYFEILRSVGELWICKICLFYGGQHMPKNSMHIKVLQDINYSARREHI